METFVMWYFYIVLFYCLCFFCTHCPGGGGSQPQDSIGWLWRVIRWLNSSRLLVCINWPICCLLPLSMADIYPASLPFGLHLQHLHSPSTTQWCTAFTADLHIQLFIWVEPYYQYVCLISSTTFFYWLTFLDPVCDKQGLIGNLNPTLTTFITFGGKPVIKFRA